MGLWQTITHEATIDDWTQKRPVDANLTAHQLDVHDIADTLNNPPTTIDATYMQRCVHAAQLVGVNVPPPPDPQKTTEGSQQLAVPAYWSWLFPNGNPMRPLDRYC